MSTKEFQMCLSDNFVENLQNLSKSTGDIISHIQIAVWMVQPLFDRPVFFFWNAVVANLSGEGKSTSQCSSDFLPVEKWKEQSISFPESGKPFGTWLYTRVIVETCKSNPTDSTTLVLCPNVWRDGREPQFWWPLQYRWDVFTWCPRQSRGRVWWPAGNRPLTISFFSTFYIKPQRKLEKTWAKNLN